MKRLLSISIVAVTACVAGQGSGSSDGDTLRITASRTEGSGCTTVDPMVLVITDLHGGAPTAIHEGEGATGPQGRHDGGATATCTKTIDDDGWQTGCTWVPNTEPGAFVEYILIDKDLGGGRIQPYLGVPPCVDLYTITRVDVIE